MNTAKTKQVPGFARYLKKFKLSYYIVHTYVLYFLVIVQKLFLRCTLSCVESNEVENISLALKDLYLSKYYNVFSIYMECRFRYTTD